MKASLMNTILKYARNSLYVEAPNSTQWADGTEPEKTLPAKWWNFMNGLYTENLGIAKKEIDLIITEINNGITSAGLNPTTATLSEALAASNLLARIKTVDGSGSGLDTDLVRATTPGAQGLTYLSKTTQALMAAQVLSDLKTVDGSGSGLDADTVDGLQPTGENNTYLAVTKNGITDLNDVDGNGIFFNSTTTASNRPASVVTYVSGMQFYIADNPTFKVQMIVRNGTDNWFVRSQANGVWRDWQKLWNEGNDGSDSGLDADLWDGIHRPRYFGSSGDGGMIAVTSGDVLTTLTKIGDTGLFSPAVVNNPSSGYCSISLILGGDNVNRSIFLATSAGSSANTWIGVKLNTAIIWTKLWSEANDGSGSGLDADLVRATTPGAQGLTYLSKTTQALMAAQLAADIKSAATVFEPGSINTGSGEIKTTGDMVAKTQASTDSSTKVATTKFVQDSASARIRVVTSDPASPANGDIWLRSDL